MCGSKYREESGSISHFHFTLSSYIWRLTRTEAGTPSPTPLVMASRYAWAKPGSVGGAAFLGLEDDPLPLLAEPSAKVVEDAAAAISTGATPGGSSES